jgi:hypothetical protein
VARLPDPGVPAPLLLARSRLIVSVLVAKLYT